MSAINWGDPRLPERFWSKVSPCPMSGCWLWTASTNQGYGAYYIGTGRSDSLIRRAHRVAYESLAGAVPTDLDLDHRCRVRACCNPAHLEPVTRRENLLRGDTVTARSASVTHCPKGHPYDAANTNRHKVRGGRGWARQCRACNKARCAAWWEAKRKAG